MFNAEVGKVFCKVCREWDRRTIFATNGCINIQINVLQDHAKLKEHRMLMYAEYCGKRTMKSEMAIRPCNEAMRFFSGNLLY